MMIEKEPSAEFKLELTRNLLLEAANALKEFDLIHGSKPTVPDLIRRIDTFITLLG
jgi:hypothetical protein